MEPTRLELQRQRHQVGHANAFLAIYLIILMVALLLWNEAPRSGLLIWAALLGVAAPTFRLTHVLKTSFTTWYRAEIASKIAVGTAYGSITLLALPDSEVHQALLCVILVAVMISSASYSSQLAGIHAAFLIALASAAILGFVIHPNGLIAAAIFSAVGFAFSLRLESEHRAGNTSTIDVIMERNSLIGELEGERDALEAANQQLETQAWTDSLTGLANRAEIMRRLSKRLTTVGADGLLQSAVTVAYVDLDGFKQVNDLGGHEHGDRILTSVAQRMMAGTSGNEVLGRFGGDEFIVISNVGLDELGAAVDAMFDEPITVDGTKIRINAGIGVATTTTPVASDELLRWADAALYRQKRDSTNEPWSVWDEPLRQELDQERNLEQRAGEALDRGDIAAWFQPVVDMSTCQIIGAEALARWVDGDQVRSAGSFIHALTSSGRIPELTTRMVDGITDLHDQMKSAGLQPMRINVNVPAPYLEWVLDEVVPEQLLPHLAIEVTEGDAIRDMSHIESLVAHAQNGGATVLIDDFGVAYSSLSRATELPIDGLKIDCMFVKRLLESNRSVSVVQTMVELAARLEVDMVAEGVEHPAQATALLQLGVTKAQGFLYSPAIDPLTFVDWVRGDYRFGTQSLAA